MWGKSLLVICVMVVAFLVGNGFVKDGHAALLVTSIKINTIKCGEAVTGVSPSDLKNQNVTCAVRIKTIIRQCQNNGGNAGNAGSYQFQSAPEVIEVVQGSSLTLTRQGKALADITISEEEMAAAFPDEDNNGIADALDPALACTNASGNPVGGGTWTVAWKVYEFDLMADLLTANTAGTLIGNSCQIASFNGLDSCVGGITSTDCHIEECLRYVPCLKDQANLVVPDGTNCTCAEYYKNGTSTTKCKNLDTNVSQ